MHTPTRKLRREEAIKVIKGFEAGYVEHLEKIWYDDKDPHEFWIHEFILHSSTCISSHMVDYFTLVDDLASTYLEGGPDDIIEILLSLGYRFGQFYEAQKVREDLKKRLGADVFLVFVEFNNDICLLEIGIAFDDKKKLIDHPAARTTPEGFFKLCGLEFYNRYPVINWAQREDKIFMTVDLTDLRDSKVNVEPEGVFKFSATAGADIHYELMLELLDKINVEESEINTSPWSISCILEKAESKQWNKLLKGDETPYYVKEDKELFAKNAPADAGMDGMDFSSIRGMPGMEALAGMGGMVGMGGMPDMEAFSGMGGMCGMPGMGGMGGMPGMGGMSGMGDFAMGDDFDGSDDKVQEATEPEGEDNKKVGEEIKTGLSEEKAEAPSST